MGELCAGVPSPCPLTASRAVEPAVTSFAPRIGAVISSSSSKKSKAEDAMGVVDMSAKGKKDSSKTTCLEVIMRFDPNSRHR
jgi:hypothetical protein